jgi:signal transduction histidine kinase
LQLQAASTADRSSRYAKNNLSKVHSRRGGIRQLIGDGPTACSRVFSRTSSSSCSGTGSTAPDLIFGAQLNLNRVVDGLRGLVQPEPALQNEICLALLDDNAKPVVISRAAFQANWKRPFVATEVGEALPHWEVAAYLRQSRAAHASRAHRHAHARPAHRVLVLAIGVGSWLIVRSLNAELKLARQKTDFVSNVSHELKTPLTSIRMFSELLAEGRVADPPNSVPI